MNIKEKERLAEGLYYAITPLTIIAIVTTIYRGIWIWIQTAYIIGLAIITFIFTKKVKKQKKNEKENNNNNK